jgi:hypothetical protein
MANDLWAGKLKTAMEPSVSVRAKPMPRTSAQMSLRFSLAFIFLFALSSCATLYAPPKPMPIGEVVNLSKAGTPAQVIIQRIRESRTTYGLRGADFAKLKADGVPDPVLDYLQQSFVDDLDLQTRYWATGEASLGGCAWCYPQPVDVDKLESGFGVVPAIPPGRYQAGRPMGTPDWVPYPQNPPSGAFISVSDVEQMSKDGVPDAQIIERINHAPLTNVIGVGGTFTIRTQPVAGLSGSTLALLHEQGVPYGVLDALQGQFLAQFIEVERLRYQNIGQGSIMN